MKHVAILGSTGSIGTSALAVVDAHPDRLKVVGLAAGANAEALAAQVVRYRPKVVALAEGGGGRCQRPAVRWPAQTCTSVPTGCWPWPLIPM